MKSCLKIFSLALLGAALLVGCSKELSYEEDANAAGGGGTLVGSPGSCSNTEINGLFAESVPLDSTNYLVVDLDVPKAGTFAVRTDTVNGVYFAGTVTATAAGVQRITLKGNGTPLAAGQFTFTAKSDPSFCSVVVDILAAAAGIGSDYFPMTSSNWWTYKSNDPAATGADTVRQLSTNQNMVIAGNNYKIFTLSSGGPALDSAYYRKVGTEYAEYTDIDILGVGDEVSPAEYVFLKETAPVGTEWFSPEVNNKVGGNPVKFRLKLRVIERNATVLQDGKVYYPVIKIRVTQQAQLSPTAPWTDVASVETWFARGIGLINLAAPAPIYGYRLIKYQVN